MATNLQRLWHKRHVLGFGILAMASSGFGQTFFISVFGSELRGAFDLSHTVYGTLYSAATLCSAILLVRAGTWADRWPLARVSTLAFALLALGCALIGFAPHVAVLALGFFLIRFGGQGMSAHIGITTAGRYFTANRGKAVAITACGIPLAEAVLPPAGALLLALGGWRLPWLVAVAVLLLAVIPLARYLAHHSGQPPHARTTSNENSPNTGRRDFTRAEALRDPGMYMLLPAVLASPFIVTALLFHQAAVAELRGWSMEWVATAFTAYAVGHLGMLLLSGPIVDRIGAHRWLPLALLPTAAGLALLALASATWVIFGYLGLLGVSVGAIATVNGALWPERYGTTHLGAIRAVAQAAMVVSTAAAPILLGFVLDLGWSVATIGSALAAFTLAAAALAALAPYPGTDRTTPDPSNP